MKDKLLVSIVVPMYNAEKFIAKCLEHLVHQTYKNLEIIIVDDGSKDNSVSICKKYAKDDKRIKIISQKNGGPSVASNTGLANATGDLVHIHDHDDFVNLDFYEKMVNVAELTNADILCGEVNQPEYNFPRFNSIEICVSMKDKILKTRANKFNPAWRYVYKKSFLNKNHLLFEPGIFGAQDLFFTKSAIVLAETVATVPGAVYNVVDTETALGKSRSLIKERTVNPALIKAQEKMQKLFSDKGATEYMNLPEMPFKIEEFKIFNLTIAKKTILPNKIRYYLFGINIGTKRIRY